MHPFLDTNWKPNKELNQDSLERVKNLSTLKKGAHIHISGVCGTGTASVLQLLKDLGYKVTGSDKAFYPPMGDVVKKLADKVYTGYSQDNLKERPDLVVIGNSLSKNNPEIEFVLKENIPFASMPEVFAGLLIGDKEHCRNSIVVTGTHGKTTTSAAISTLLEVAGLKPGYFIGGMPKNLSSSIRRMELSLPLEKRTVVLEGDEYDSCFYAKYPKFHSYRPDILIVTSIEFDHGDIYNSIEEIEAEFTKLLRRVPGDGTILVCDEGKRLEQILPQWQNDIDIIAPIYLYGEKVNSRFKLESRNVLNNEQGQELKLKLNKIKVKTKTPLTGRHNALNLLVAAAVSEILGVSPENIKRGVETFSGVLRRQNLIAEVKGRTIIEDFAHHPSAVKVTLEGLKESYPKHRLIAVYEPRSNTSRRAFFQKDYIESFKSADVVVMLEVQNNNIYSNTNASTDTIDVKQLTKDIANTSGKLAICFNTVDEIITFLKHNSRESDLIVLMSNGDFGGLAQKLPKEI